MWPSRLLLLSVVVALRIHISFAQLRNSTLLAQGIDELDYFDPDFYNVNGTRIVGGRQVPIRQVPWQIALYNNGYFICGGSMVSVNWVLTAAHCVDGGGSFAVRAGSPYVNRGGTIRWAREVIISSGYNANTVNHDIAMIRVRTNFQITEYSKPIALARRGRKLPQRFFVSGWGTVREGGSNPNHIRGVTIRRISRRQCRRKYKNDGVAITRYMICAAAPGKDSCQGDSGGPLVRRQIQYGIVSFGIGCASPRYPGVYTNIGRTNRWIRKVVKRWGGSMPKFV